MSDDEKPKLSVVPDITGIRKEIDKGLDALDDIAASDAVLEGCKGQFARVLIVGVDEEGLLSVISNGTPQDSNWILDMAKLELLDSAETYFPPTPKG